MVTSMPASLNDSEPPMRPQHDDEGRPPTSTAVVTPATKSTGDFSRDPDVVGDPIFGILVIAGH